MFEYIYHFKKDFFGTENEWPKKKLKKRRKKILEVLSFLIIPEKFREKMELSSHLWEVLLTKRRRKKERKNITICIRYHIGNGRPQQKYSRCIQVVSLPFNWRKDDISNEFWFRCHFKKIYMNWKIKNFIESIQYRYH